MTIKVEREALIALQSQPWPSSSVSSNDDDDDNVIRIYRKYPAHHDHYLSKDLLPGAVSTDDEDSVYTTSTTTCSDSDTSDIDRRVCFADDLVTDVWTRPYTEKERIAELYYSNDETHRFRQEYRLERKLLSSLNAGEEFSVDASGIVDEEDLTSLILSTANKTPSSIRHRNGISRVVVLHNDRLETFCSSSATKSSCSSGSSSLLSSPLLPAASLSADDQTPQEDFFDTPEFWSGSITWW